MEEQGFFYRDTWAEVDLDCIQENVASVKKLLPEEVDIFAVVKANGYGHGDVQVAETALEAGATYLAVAFMDEAIALRKKGIKAPILVLGATRAEDVLCCSKSSDNDYCFSKGMAARGKETFNCRRTLSVHIKA